MIRIFQVFLQRLFPRQEGGQEYLQQTGGGGEQLEGGGGQQWGLDQGGGEGEGPVKAQLGFSIEISTEK